MLYNNLNEIMGENERVLTRRFVMIGNLVPMNRFVMSKLVRR